MRCVYHLEVGEESQPFAKWRVIWSQGRSPFLSASLEDRFIDRYNELTAFNTNNRTVELPTMTALGRLLSSAAEQPSQYHNLPPRSDAHIHNETVLVRRINSDGSKTLVTHDPDLWSMPIMMLIK